MPFRRRQIPFAVAEDDIGLVAGHNILKLRDHMLADVARFVGEPERVVPLVERVVNAHVQTFAANGVGEIAQQIALRPRLHSVPRTAPRRGSFLAGPKRKAFMMLGSQRDILRAGALEHVRPMIGIEQLGAKLRREVLIREVRAVFLLVISPRAGLYGRRLRIVAAVGHRIPVPLGISEFAGDHGRIRRHRIDAPVNEDAELCVAEPDRRGPLVKRIPVRLISLRMQGAHGE